MAKKHLRKSHHLMSVMGALLLMAGVFLPTPTTASAAAPGPTISLMIDGTGIKTDVTPQIVKKRMLVPLRAIAENTGVKVEYTASTGRVTLKTRTHSSAVFIGKKKAYQNGKALELDTATNVVRRRTMVPIRFVSEALGYQVTWNAQARVAHIQTKRPSAGRSIQADQYTKNIYVVKAGDTLSAIAKNHQTSLRKLKKNNQIQSEQLHVGQIIYLPENAAASRNPLKKLVSDQRLLAKENVYPVSRTRMNAPLFNTYGDGRIWGGDSNGRSHEGIDIMADKGTPVYAAAAGKINRIGWNTYGGWRINITDSSGKYKLYYAHLDAFTPGLRVGSSVKAGQLIGFVGDSGYGYRGTEGKFAPHLHFGLYQASNNKPLNPFYYLKYWEINQTNKQIL